MSCKGVEDYIVCDGLHNTNPDAYATSFYNFTACSYWDEATTKTYMVCLDEMAMDEASKIEQTSTTSAEADLDDVIGHPGQQPLIVMSSSLESIILQALRAKQMLEAMNPKDTWWNIFNFL